MFGIVHILYIVFSLLAVGLILFGAHFIKSQKWKDVFLAFWAVLCFLTHISIMWVTFVKNDGSFGEAYDNILFPIYFCNYMMYLLLIVSLFKNKKSKIFNWLATFVAYGGVFGSLITLFVTPPDFSSFESVKSALSHTFMLIGCLYLFVGGYVKVNVFNLIPYFGGLVSCAVVGGVVELIFMLCGLPSPNAMYLRDGPWELPEFKCWMFALVMLTMIFIFTMLWENFSKKKEERWFKNTNDLGLYFPEKIFKRRKNIEE